MEDVRASRRSRDFLQCCEAAHCHTSHSETSVWQEPMGTGLWGAREEGVECPFQPTVLSGRDFVPHAMFGTETFLFVTIKDLGGDFSGIWWVKHHIHGRHMLQ